MIARYPVRFIAVLALAAGCASERKPDPAAGPTASAPAEPPSVGIPEDSTPTIVFLGTSLTAGFGLADPGLAYPALIQKRLDSLGLKYHAINAGLSGETSAGALRRIDWLLDRGTIAVLMIETGANDGLRGQDPDSTRANIQTIVAKAQALEPKPRIIIAGMEAMPNLGAEYTRRFRAIYPAVAKANGAVLLPFLLDGVAGIDSLNQADGIHPTPAGQRIVAENVWRVLKPLLAAP